MQHHFVHTPTFFEEAVLLIAAMRTIANDRMKDMGLEPNVKENHPYKVDPEELGGDYISGNLIWILDVNPTNNSLEYAYFDEDGGYDTDVRLSDVKEVGGDYLRFGL